MHRHELNFQFSFGQRRVGDYRIETKLQRFGIDATQRADTHGDGLHWRQALPRDFLQNSLNDGGGDGKLVHNFVLHDFRPN